MTQDTEAERFDPEPWDIRRASMKRAEDGGWVRYDDYLALAAERDSLRNQVEAEAIAASAYRDERDALREALDGIYIYANDTLSGRADGGPDDRAWQRAAVVEIRNRAREFAATQSAVDARAALTGEAKP